MKILFWCLILSSVAQASPQKIKLALNWKAEPQFGGFYAAALEGEFKKRGLDVEILQGGSGTPTIQMLSNGTVPLAIVSGEEVVVAQDRNPKNKIFAVFATYQTYPCILMSRSERGFKKMQDLFQADGVLSVQSGLPYFQFLSHKFGKPKAKVVPYLGGISYFMQDKKLSQQGFVTSEPLLAAKQGVAVTSFLVADEGFNPYTTVVAVTSDYWQKHPNQVKGFVQAVRAGWGIYLKSPEKTNKYMAQLNKSMSMEVFSESAEAQRKLIETTETQKKFLGWMTDARWKTLSEQLKDIGLIQKAIPPRELYKAID